MIIYQKQRISQQCLNFSYDSKYTEKVLLCVNFLTSLIIIIIIIIIIYYIYYNANIWLTPDLTHALKQNLLSISACALRSCMYNNLEMSFDRLHAINKKCTPNQIMLYQLSLSLYKTFNVPETGLNFEAITVIDQMILTSRQVNFQILKNNRRKIGINTTANKLYSLNNLIGLDRLNLNFLHYKKLAKIQFLKNGKT